MHVSVAFSLWASIFGLFYAYVGYPILISILIRIRNVSQAKPPPGHDLPTITVLVSAYNAEQHLQERIRNILDCDYPADRMSVLIASDGSTDETVKVVRKFGDNRVQVIDNAVRRGKSATLVDAVTHATSPVIVFTDVTTRFDRSSILNLARHFSDASVGLVAGMVRMVDSEGKPSESLYWRIEMMLRRCEASIGTTMGASGAIYAVRRSLFVAPSKPIINDDLVLPMLLCLKHDCRLVMEENALALVTSVGGFKAEFSRRSRIGIGAFQCLPVLKDLWQWRNIRMAAVFVSHKLLRWLCPFLLLSAFICNVVLLRESIYQWLMVLQVLAYSASLFGLLSRGQGLVTRSSRIATSFVLMNVALAVGVFRWMAKPDTVTWNPTSRPRWETAKQPSPFESNSHQHAA